MKGILAKVEFKQYEAHRGANAGKKFKLCVLWVDVVDAESGEVRCYRGSMNVEFAKKYFAHCGYTSVTAIGKPCDVQLRTREYVDADGETHRVRDIKWFNFVDADGKKLIYKEADDEPQNLPF